jgi:hypothetical protein
MNRIQSRGYEFGTNCFGNIQVEGKKFDVMAGSVEIYMFGK